MVGISSAVLMGMGLLVGVLASFAGLGGGFLIVPLLSFLGYSGPKAVGTSFLAIFIISISALVAHNKLANVDYRLGLLIGIGGIIGAQIGSRFVEYVPQAVFNKVFALILLAVAARMFFAKA